MSENFKIISTVKTHEQAEKVLSYPNVILRINSSHMETPNLVQFVTELTEKYKNVEIYVDLQGSKIRISRNQPQLTLKKDEKINLTIDEPTPDTKSIHIGNPNTIKLLSKGTKVKIDDGRIELIVDSIINESNAVGIITKEGTLRPGKGFNLYPHPFVQNQLSKRDIEIVENLKNFNNIKFALSFVSVPKEILDLKKRSNNKYVAAKIEREMTKEQVDAICKVCDSVWICRGDMGVQMGFIGMTKFVREFTKKYIPNLKVPCIIAGEVMEHLCEHPASTRTEICYLANCIMDGYKGLVLSDETVFGKYPKETVEFCYNYINEFCKSYNIVCDRAFYNSINKYFKDITLKEEKENGESAFKECRNITIENSDIFLKYTFWNCHNLNLINVNLEKEAKESIWYCKNITITNSKILSIKSCRNCENLTIKDSNVDSEDFCWKNEGIKIEKSIIKSNNLLQDGSNITVDSCQLSGENSLQYAQNVKIYNTTIDGDNCLWNAKNVYCKNCNISGGRLGWHSENIFFEDCHINSSQPLCYCNKLKMVNCTMANANLAFEFSYVEADIHSHVFSIRNVLKGKIVVDSYGEYIKDSKAYDCKGIIQKRNVD